MFRLHEGSPEPVASRQLDMPGDDEAVSHAREILEGLAALAPGRKLHVGVGQGYGGPETLWLGVWAWDGEARWTAAGSG